MRELLRATVIGSVAQVVNVTFAVIGGKVLALALEPAGVGVVSQVGTYAGLATNILSLGLGVGLTRYIAEYRGRKDDTRLKTLIVTALVVALLVSFLITGLLLALGPLITRFAFGDPNTYRSYIQFMTLTFPFSVTATFIVSLLQGFKQVSTLAKLTMLNGLINLLLLLILVPTRGLAGGVYTLALTAFFTFMVNSLFLFKLLDQEFGTTERPLILKLRAIPRWISVVALVPLIGYGLSSLVVGGAGNLVDFFSRAEILKGLGETFAGYYQSAYAISNRYLPLVLGAMSIYAFPHFSELTDEKLIRSEITTTFRFAILVITPVLVVLMTVAHVLIPLLWSMKFLPSIEILHGLLLSDFFLVATWALGMVLLPNRRVRFWFINSIVTQGLILVLFLVFFPKFGIMGAVYNYLIGWIVNGLAVYLYLRRVLHFSLPRREAIFLLASLVVVVIAFFMAKLPWQYGGVSLLALGIWAAYFIQREEWGHLRWLSQTLLPIRSKGGHADTKS